MLNSLFGCAFATFLMLTSNLQADLNKPHVLNRNLANQPDKKMVLIYYANETASDPRSDQNHETIVRWLRSSENKQLCELGDTIDADRGKLKKIVQQEIEAISSNQSLEISVVIFSNRMAAMGRFAFRRVGDKKIETAPLRLNLPTSRSFIYTSHPLAHPSSLQQALVEVAARFCPLMHDFVLITKSHGASNRPLIPRLGIDASKTTRQKLLEGMLKDHSKLQSWKLLCGLDNAKEKNKLGTSKDGNLGTSSTGGLGTAEGKFLIGEEGTTKEQYAMALHSVYQSDGMQFRIVFVEACQSEFAPDLISHLQDSVGILFTSDKIGLPYQSINYNSLFSSMRCGVSLSESLERQLTR